MQKRWFRYLVIFVVWGFLFMFWYCFFSLREGTTQKIVEIDKKGQKHVETTLKDEYDKLSALLAVVCVSVGTIVVDYNRIQRMKADIPNFRGDVQALEERRERQLNQANRVVDKYMAHEKSIQKAVAHSHVKKASDFSHYIEQFPELKANQSVATLLAQMNQLESELFTMKLVVNNEIADYNATIHSFPISIFRKVLKFEDIQIELEDKRVYEEEISDEELGIG